MPTSCTVFAINNHEVNAHQTSLFAGLQTCKFQLSCVAWSHAWHRSDRNKFPSDKDRQKVADEIAMHPLVFALDHLESALGPELQGDFPMARLNWFEIFLTFTEILSEMGRAAHAECIECRKSARGVEFWVRKGCGAVKGSMRKTDIYEDVGISGFGSEHLGVVEPAWNAIRSAVSGESGPF